MLSYLGVSEREGGRGNAGSPDFGRSVNQRSTRRRRSILCLPIVTPQFFRPSDVPVISLLAPALKDEEKTPEGTKGYLSCKVKRINIFFGL